MWDNNQDLKKDIIGRFNLGKENKISLLKLNETRMKWRKLSSDSSKPSVIYSLLENFTKEMFWYIWLRSPNKTVRKNMNRFLTDRKVKLSLNGEDIKKMGIKSGRQIGEIMDFVFKQKIDRGFNSREEELEMAKFFIKNIEE
jgi:hypothetical protein